MTDPTSQPNTQPTQPSPGGGRRFLPLFLGGVGLLAVATTVVLLVMHPWSGNDSDAAPRQSFELNGGRTLGLVVPEGWAARGYKTQYAVYGVILEPEGDPNLASDAQRLVTGGSASGPHAIIIGPESNCVGGTWDLGPVETSMDAGVTVTGRKASLLAQDSRCAFAKAGDREATAGPSAVEALEELTKTNAMVVTRAASK